MGKGVLSLFAVLHAKAFACKGRRAVYKVIYRWVGSGASDISERGGGGGGGGGVVKVRCRKCGYEWEYKGRLGLATCPNCGAKAKVPKGERR